MAEVDNTPADNLDDRRDLKEDKPSTENDSSSLLPPPKRRGDRDSRERKDEKDLDRYPPRRPGGDYYDRNRSPPPRHPIRDRDYKRRLSASPPPPYRDRRHSPPPRRSSPLPPFKRSRRDDGGYDRRGSPRGGYGHGNRRFGNDYGNERDMGGRLNYGNDRPRGQHFGRISDWDADHGDYNDGGNMDNAHRQGLMSYKQFIQELEDDILPSEAERRYQEYKSEYITTQKQTYFDAHKDEEWFKDKYHPTNLPAAIERRNERARKAAEDFLNDLQSGTLDLNPGVKATPATGPEQTSEPNADNEVDDGGKRTRHGRVLSKDDDLISSAPKAHAISSDPRRIIIDIEQGLELVKKLDSEKKIDGNILSRADKSSGSSSGPVVIVRSLASVKGLEGIELLDTLLTYLWRIHGVDYYGLVESSEAKGLRHVRQDGKSSDAAAPNGSEWEKKIDSHWQERLKGQDPLEVRACREKLDAAATNLLDPSVRKIRDEKYGWKYGCGAKGCTKLFHAAEFVYKHLKLKHIDLVGELTNKLREDFFRENYMNDPDAPGGTPIMQQPKPRERPQQQRRRLGMEHRLRDDRGNQMEFENQDHHGGGGGGGKQDEMMFDSSSGGGLNNDGSAAFPSDGHPPPPVLMPIPGAGPLGPFVPAPPEVAMRMMREQGGGGGPPYGVNNGRNNNNNNNGPSGPSPIIALPPSFRQDPRRLRSYQDLDAPDDEVTVIDYRSL
ncbi:serrate RNA effector molecule-like [Impatiens glandulifera]|uniref:serrate RNA effector molecule-like n=1 Tax=Impatiens glandulifera TaxID=253017 RepID=UPI001FB085D6|nr:serrate RNA effector molecule-like [Impatiens glandulifera]